ncbi:hypothetical protein LK07_18700 [Streptomyces pluripotens]|uniref:Secreted protein n=1 Tax=Streptomyces pluripotens TaxID=1355015 RepID=A0A221P0M8_9ACTN|nr:MULTISPECIES: hypothetical protein [Streptomyces]ARP71454.1 hypothetical protein LK06_017545 [Streptomyces pluripotens]ASN25704.1 hypothetical protein LK07_18700 [Streptomyces pluripotens]KIE25027.1 hypothetical protein LK08_21030 [Streptomyces sp. MUSC 125]MCH0560145.1 hypothetical protein [Streptomyces sp. MUM 16J]
MIPLKFKRVISVCGATAALIAGGATTAQAQVHPHGACRGANGPFLEVLHNYGKPFKGVGTTYRDWNGGTGTATSSFTNRWTGTVSSTVSASLGVSGNWLAVEVSGEMGYSHTWSSRVTTGHTVTYKIPAKRYGNARYGVWQDHLYLKTYRMNDGCKKYDIKYADSRINRGRGWNFWISKS